jgi:sugar porter (SP) family MFS transporter
MGNVRDKGSASGLYAYVVSLVAAVGGFLFGYDLAIISGAMIFLKREFHLSPSQLGFATASALLGCMVGSVAGGGMSDRIGRRKALMAAAALFGVGAVGTALPRSMFEFDVFRIVGGVGVGLAAVVSPMYIVEIAPARMRGRLVTINQLAIVTGLLCSVVVAYFLSGSGAWRWMFASNLVPVLWLTLGLIFIPESPRWMVHRGREPEALAVLASIDGEEHALAEMKQIREDLASDKSTYSELIRPGMRTALIVACALAIFSQISGVSILLFYAPMIFQSAGFHNASDAILQNLIVQGWNLVCTIAALYMVDRVGRRPLLLLGTFGMAVGLVLMGAFFSLKLSGLHVVVTMFISVGAYVMSLGPLAWLIMSEIFPTRLRGKAMGIASLCVWIACFLAAQYFPPMVAWFEKTHGSSAGVFWIYAAVCIAAFLFTLRMVPETKGRSLEEIGASWTRKRQEV